MPSATADPEHNRGEELTVNEKFAAKYEHEKQRDEIAWRRQQGLDEESDSDDSSDDEDASLLTKGLDRQIQKTMELIRKKDPKIYDGNAELYDSDEQDEGESSSGSSDDDSSSDDSSSEVAKPAKPMTIKDMVRERTIAKLEAGEDASESGSDDEAPPQASRTYVQEQAALKQATRAAVKQGNRPNAADDSDDSDDDLLFTVKVRTAEEEEALAAVIADSYSKEEESEAARLKRGDEILARGSNRAASMPDGDGEMEEQTELDAEQFLHDYIANQRWLDRPGNIKRSKKRAKPTAGADDDDDAEFESKNDKYEQAYNFRFEEGNLEIIGHARRTNADAEGDGLARRPDERRKQKRAAKKARREEKKHEQAEELKRLKNLKKVEMEQRLQRAGGLLATDTVGGIDLDAALDGEFDPQSWDAKMASAFGDDYYNDTEAAATDGTLLQLDPEGELREAALAAGKPWPPVEDEGAHTGEGSSHGGGAASLADETDLNIAVELRQAAQRARAAAKANTTADEEIIGGRTDADLGPAASGNSNSAVDLEALYAMDYEDIIAGGLKTRFKYRQVEPDTFGLTMEEIFELDDRELNRRASLKKLAPYRAKGRGGGRGGRGRHAGASYGSTDGAGRGRGRGSGRGSRGRAGRRGRY